MVSTMQWTLAATRTKVQVHHSHRSTSQKNTQILSNGDPSGNNHFRISSSGSDAAQLPPRGRRRIADVEICESNDGLMEPANASRYTLRMPNPQKSHAITPPSSNSSSRILRNRMCEEEHVTDTPAGSQLDTDSLPSSPYLPPTPAGMPLSRNPLFDNHKTPSQTLQVLIITESVGQGHSMTVVESEEYHASTPTRPKRGRCHSGIFEGIVSGGAVGVGGRIGDAVSDVNDLVLASIEGKEDDDDGEEYEVERIVGEKIGKGIHEYLIQWVGYDELNWISADDCFCPDLIAEFRSVQRVGLVEAALAGRESEAERLRKFANAAKIEAKILPEQPKPANPSKSQRDPKTGRFVKKALRTKRSKIATVEMGIGKSADSSDPERDESHSVSRDARANTARLPVNRPVASVWDTCRDIETGEIIWIRRERGVGQKMTPENRDAQERAKAEARAKERGESIEVWMTTVAEMECAEMERRRTEDAEEEVRKERVKIAMENQKVEEHLREMELTDLSRKELQPKKLELQKLEEEELENRALERKGLEDREADRRLEISPERNQRRSSTVFRGDLVDAQKLRIKSQERRIQNTLANASAEKLAKSLRMASVVEANKSRGERSSSSMRRSEQADQLRVARDEEARVKKSICPSLVRSEFRKSMSTKHAEALVNLTRGSPESARHIFGLTMLPNTVSALSKTVDEP